MNEESTTVDQRGKSGFLARNIARFIELAKEKDPPGRIALGMGLGIFVGFLPIMGIQMAVVSMLAIPLRGNLKAAIAGVWISNPLTFIPLYYASYRLGLLFLPTRRVTWDEFKGAISQASEWDWAAVKSSLSNLVDIGAEILIPLWTGSTILAVIFGVATYFVSMRLVIRNRARKAAS